MGWSQGLVSGVAEGSLVYEVLRAATTKSCRQGNSTTEVYCLPVLEIKVLAGLVPPEASLPGV